jgi:hypothetical protein
MPQTASGPESLQSQRPRRKHSTETSATGKLSSLQEWICGLLAGGAGGLGEAEVTRSGRGGGKPAGMADGRAGWRLPDTASVVAPPQDGGVLPRCASLRSINRVFVTPCSRPGSRQRAIERSARCGGTAYGFRRAALLWSGTSTCSVRGRLMPGLVTILCICFGIGVDGANPSYFARLATSGSADERSTTQPSLG